MPLFAKLWLQERKLLITHHVWVIKYAENGHHGAVYPPSEQLAHQQLAQGAWPRQVPATPRLNLAGAASNVAGLHPDVLDRMRSRLHPVPSLTVPLSGRDPRLPTGTQLTGRANPGDAASSASWASAGTFNTGTHLRECYCCCMQQPLDKAKGYPVAGELYSACIDGTLKS